MSSPLRPVSNPPNPWLSAHVEWLGEPPVQPLEIFEEEAKSIIASNSSPDVGFEYSVNPYRGCFHACAYCYARPRHQLLGFGAGTDFDRKIVVKTNAPRLLRAELLRRAWKGELIAFSGDTDCYQPLEASYELTRRCLEVCLEFRQPVSVITKGIVVRRDAALLGALAAQARAHVTLSIPFADDASGRRIEPYASTSTQRFESLRILSDAGVPTGIAIAPVIPGLNDSDIPELLERAHARGARYAFMVMLRLPDEVRPVFEERLAAAFPERAAHVTSAIREVRGGFMNDSRFGHRGRGRGPRWQAIEQLFELHCRRLGLNQDHGAGDGHRAAAPATTFRRPSAQGSLFDGFDV